MTKLHELTLESSDDMKDLFCKLHKNGQFDGMHAHVELSPRNYLLLVDKLKSMLAPCEVACKIGDYTIHFNCGNEIAQPRAQQK